MLLEDELADSLLADPPPKKRKAPPPPAGDDLFADIPVTQGPADDDLFADIPMAAPRKVAPPPAVARPAGPTFNDYAGALVASREPAPAFRGPSSLPAPGSGLARPEESGVRTFGELADALAQNPAAPKPRALRARQLQAVGTARDEGGWAIGNLERRFDRSLVEYVKNVGKGLQQLGPAPGEPEVPSTGLFMGDGPVGRGLNRLGRATTGLFERTEDQLGSQPAGSNETMKDVKSVGGAFEYAGKQFVNLSASMLVSNLVPFAGNMLELQGETAEAINARAEALGVPVDPIQRRLASKALGGAAGLLDYVTLRAVTAPIRKLFGTTVVDQAAGLRASREAVSRAVTNGDAGFFARLARGGARTAGGAIKLSGLEALNEGGQQATTSGLAPAAVGLDVDWTDVADQTKEAAVGAFAGSLVLGVPTQGITAKRTATVERSLASEAGALVRLLSRDRNPEASAPTTEAAPGAPSAPAAAPRQRTAQEESRAVSLERFVSEGGLAPDELAAVQAEINSLPPRLADIGDGTPVPVPPAAPAPAVAPVSEGSVTDRRTTARIGSRYEKFTDEGLQQERVRLATLGPDADPFDGLFSPVELRAEMDRREASRIKAPLPVETDPLPDDPALELLHRDMPDPLLETRRAAELEEYLNAPSPEIQGSIRRKIAVLDAERARRAGAQQTASPALPPSAPVSVPRGTAGQDDARAVTTPRMGRKTKLVFPDGGTKVEAQYEVREADELIASHNPDTFSPDARYPTEVQGRAYDKDKAAQDYVAQATLSYDPDKALDPTLVIGNGPTVITRNGVAVAGNQRLMIRQRASQQQPQRVAAYITQLIENAGEYGLNPDDIRAMKNPVLVRVITDSAVNTDDMAGLKELNRRSDEVDTKVKRATDEAAGTAAALSADPALMAFLSDAMAQDEKLTLSEFFDTARGKDFVRQLVVAGIIPRSRVAQLIRDEPSSGKLTDEGKGFVRRMLLAAALEDVSLLDRVPQKMLLKIERVIPAILTSQRIPGYGLASQLRQALEVMAEANDKNIPVSEFVDQITLGQSPLPDQLRLLVLFLDKRDSKTIRERLTQYADQAQKYAVSDTAPEEDGFGFDDVRITKTPEDLLEGVTAANLFDSGEDDATGPGAALLAYVPKETAAQLQNDLFFGPKATVVPPAGAPVFDPARKDSGYRAAWATLMNDRERARVAAGRPSAAFLDAFAIVRGDAKMLPEEARFRGDGQGSFRTENADQGDMFGGSDNMVMGAAEKIAKFYSRRWGKEVNGTVQEEVLQMVRVDGKDRHVTNSNGKAIAKTIEGLDNFWRWFGESTVVDEYGRPKVMYHGTRTNFQEFDPFLGRYGLFGQGAYFTDNPGVASNYATGRGGARAQVYPVYLRLERPMDMDAEATPGEWLPEAVENASGTTNEAMFRGLEEDFRQNDQTASDAAEIMADQIEFKMGYDGITHVGGGRLKNDSVRHRVFITFDARAVKSAIGNNEQFNPSDERMSRALESENVSQFDLGLFDPPVPVAPDDPSLSMASDWAGPIPPAFEARYGKDRNPILLVHMIQLYQRTGNKDAQIADIIAELARRGVTRFGRVIPGGAPLQAVVPVEPVPNTKDTIDDPDLPGQALTADAMRSASIMRYRAVLNAMRVVKVNGVKTYTNALNMIRPVRKESPALYEAMTRDEALETIRQNNPGISDQQAELLVSLYTQGSLPLTSPAIYEGLRYFGVSFKVLEALENNTTVNLIGQKVVTLQDFAVLLLAARDPFLEVGRTVFLDADRRIVGHEILSLGVPNRTRTVVSWLDAAVKKAVYDKKMKTGLGNAKLTRDETLAIIQAKYPTAVSFYDVHNHPNGSPIPSEGDLMATRALADAVAEDVYLGAMVIDGRAFSHIPSNISHSEAKNSHTQPRGESFVQMAQRLAARYSRPNGLTHDPLLTADPEFDDPRVWGYVGTDQYLLTGRTETDLAALLKQMYRPDLSPTLAVVLDAFDNIRAIVDVPNDTEMLKNPEEARAYIERLQVSMGGSTVVIVTSRVQIAERVAKLKQKTPQKGMWITTPGPVAMAVLVQPSMQPDGSFATGFVGLNSVNGSLAVSAMRGNGMLSTQMTIVPLEGVASNLFDTMRSAANLGWLDRLTRINMVTDKVIVPFQPTAEKQYQGNQGVTPAWKTRVAKAVAFMKSLPETIPALGRPTRDAMTTMTNELLLMMRRTPAHSQQLAVDFIADVLEGFTREQVDLFQRKLITDDLLKDIERNLYTDEGGNAVPLFGKDAAGARRPLADAVADLMVANADVTAAIAKDATVLDGLALMRTKRATLVMALVDEGILSAEAVADERYYHRQVLEFYRAMDSQPQSVARRGIRQAQSGFQKRRSGGGEFNSLYVESEFEWLAQSYEKLLARKVEKQIRGITDQAPMMRRMAKDRNRSMFYLKVQPLMDAYANGLPIPQWLEDLLPDRSMLPPMLPFGGSVFGTMFDPLASFRQRISLNTQRVYDAAISGQYQVAQLAPFAGLVRAIEQWDAAGRQGYFDHPQWFPFLNAIASDDTLPGSLSAKAIYKAMAERDALIEEIVGDAFVEGEDLEREAGLVSFQPVKGRTLFKASTLAEDIIEEVLNGNRDLERDDLKEVMVQGGLKERWAVPKHIAAALEDPTNGLGLPGRFSPERVWMRGMALWKFWQLYSPTRFVKYNLNNTSSDVDVSFLYPKIMVGAKGALFDLRAQADGVATMSPQLRDELRLWQRHGAIDSGQYATELGDVWKHGEFEKLADANPLAVMRLMGAYPRFVTGFSQVRENTLRLAAARYFKSEIDRTGKLPTLIASNPKLVKNLWDIAPANERSTIVAARLARDLIGDYQSISSAGSWLRSRLMPFFAWQELNIKRYFWLMRNAATDPEGVNAGALGRVAGAALFRTSTNAAIVALKVHVFFLAASLWNNWRYKDEEEKLRRNGRGLHLIYGVDDEGNIGVVRLESAFAAFLKLVALEDYPADIRDIRDGKKSFSKQSREMAQAPVNQFILAWEPVSKGLFEGLAGVSLFPDPMNPRPTKEPLRDWLNGQGIGYVDDLYRTVSGEPIPPRKPGPMAEGLTLAQRAVKTLDLYAGYRVDPGEAAYWNARQMISEYVKAQTGRNLAPARLSEQQLAIYYAKQASRWGLEDKAQEWLAEYYKRGGTPHGARGSVKNMDPLHSLPNNIQGKFLRELSERDRDMLRDAREWWRRDQRAPFRKVLTSVPYSQVRQQMRDERQP